MPTTGLTLRAVQLVLFTGKFYFGACDEMAQPSVEGALPPSAPAYGDFNNSLLYEIGGHNHAADAALRLGFAAVEGPIALHLMNLQDMLFRHQNPQQGCDGQLFIRVTKGAGPGSLLHANALAFVVALISGRIFDWHPSAMAFQDGNHSTPRGTPLNILHFLQAPSNCSATAAPRASVIDVDLSTCQGIISSFNARTLKLPFSAGHTSRLPLDYNEKIDEGVRRGASLLVRACVAYLVRLQPAALLRIRSRRVSTGLLQSSKETSDTNATALASAFPLPPHALSLHIRHGDKAKEMHLVSSEAYFRTAAKIWSKRSTPASGRVGFIWTEDPDVFDLVLRRGGYLNRRHLSGADDAEWVWIRDPAAGSLRTDLRGDSWRHSGRFAELADEFFLNVLLSLECGTFIGTWESNQDRLLGELSGVLVPKPGTTASVKANFIEAQD